MYPEVTLLVPNYNSGKYLSQSVPALLRQTFANFQLIVVDNLSTDNSVEIVRGFCDSRLRLEQAETHVPIIDNFNRAVALVDTPFFAICAADEVYEAEWLETMVPLIADHPTAFFACCKPDSADEKGRIYLSGFERYKQVFWPTNDPCVFTAKSHLRHLQKTNVFIITTGIFRTSAVRQIGPLNVNYHYVADWEYWLRGFIAGYSVVGSHRRLVHYRRHSEMTTMKLHVQLRSFRELMELADETARLGFENRLLSRAEPDYAIVRNALFMDLARRLSLNDDVGAKQLISFAQENIPGFRGSPYDWLMRGACASGRLGGTLLSACERIYVRLCPFLLRNGAVL